MPRRSTYLTAAEWERAARAVLRRQETYHGPPRLGDGGSGEAVQAAFDQLPGDVLAVLLRDAQRPWPERESSLTWEDGALVAIVAGNTYRVELEPVEQYRAGMAALNPRPVIPGAGPVIGCLCYFGLVSGLMERYAVERALQRLGIPDGQVQVIEKRYWTERAPAADILVCQPDANIRVALPDVELVEIVNLLDEDEITSKLAAALEAAGFRTRPGKAPPEPRGRMMQWLLRWSRSIPDGWVRQP